MLEPCSCVSSTELSSENLHSPFKLSPSPISTCLFRRKRPASSAVLEYEWSALQRPGILPPGEGTAPGDRTYDVAKPSKTQCQMFAGEVPA